MDTVKRMASLKTICQMYDWNPRTVKDWMSRGKFPAPYKHGRLNRWALDVIQQWATRDKAQFVSESVIKDIMR